MKSMVFVAESKVGGQAALRAGTASALPFARPDHLLVIEIRKLLIYPG
jgi:hypothetical protein